MELIPKTAAQGSKWKPLFGDDNVRFSNEPMTDTERTDKFLNTMRSYLPQVHELPDHQNAFTGEPQIQYPNLLGMDRQGNPIYQGGAPQLGRSDYYRTDITVGDLAPEFQDWLVHVFQKYAGRPENRSKFVRILQTAFPRSMPEEIYDLMVRAYPDERVYDTERWKPKPRPQPLPVKLSNAPPRRSIWSRLRGQN